MIRLINRLEVVKPERGSKTLVAIPRDDVMAIEPSALEKLWASWDVDEDDEPPYARVGGVAVIDISGPLMQRGRASWFYSRDGYDTIRAKFEQALADKAIGSVLLRINSPGGTCAGCFEGVRAMLAAKQAAAKPVFAFADESAYSAAYALACVADTICLPPEGGVGSVGVIGVLESFAEANAKMGVQVAVITSGDRKADGHPDVPLSAAVLKRVQARIDGLAENFAEVVAQSRGLTSEQVLAKQAGCFYGDSAVTERLADKVMSFDACLEMAVGEAARVLASRPVTKPFTARASANQGTMNMDKQNTGSHAASGTVLLEGLGMLGPIAVAMGLSHDASEADVLGRVSALRSLEGEILSETGAKNLTAAKAKISAWKDAAEQTSKLTAELADYKKETDAVTGAALLKAALDDGRILPAEKAKVEAKYGAEGLEWLQGYIECRVPNPALARNEVRQPVGSGSGGGSSQAATTLTREEKKAAALAGLTEAQFLASKSRMSADGLYLRNLDADD